MNSEVLQPFMESASIVIEQVVNIRPEAGDLGEKQILILDDHIWIKIEITGQLSGNVIFGLHEEVAIKLVSAMMGGYPIEALDEMGKSAISELGNMISGNASTMLYNQGVHVDISPPQLMESPVEGDTHKCLSIPLTMESIGCMDIQVLIG